MSLGVKLREEMIIYTSLGQRHAPAPSILPPASHSLTPKACCDLIPGQRALQAQVERLFEPPFPLLSDPLEFSQEWG